MSGERSRWGEPWGDPWVSDGLGTLLERGSKHMGLGECSGTQRHKAQYGWVSRGQDWGIKSQVGKAIVFEEFGFILSAMRCNEVAKWLRLCATNAGGVGSIPSQDPKIPRATMAWPKDMLIK